LAAAALAYKCVAVARMCVVLAKNVGIRRDQHELQIALQMVPLGKQTLAQNFNLFFCCMHWFVATNNQ